MRRLSKRLKFPHTLMTYCELIKEHKCLIDLVIFMKHWGNLYSMPLQIWRFSSLLPSTFLAMSSPKAETNHFLNKIEENNKWKLLSLRKGYETVRSFILLFKIFSEHAFISWPVVYTSKWWHWCHWEHAKSSYREYNKNPPASIQI